MQYMALIYTDPSLIPEMGDSINADYFALNARMKQAGVMMAGNALHPPATATSLRVRGGKTETMDGPFAETREHLGGYYVLDVPDLDTAMRYAAQIPVAAFGTVEVRPLLNYDPANT